MSKARDIYEQQGVKMRNLTPTTFNELQQNGHFVGITKATVFKFDDGSEVELYQTSRKRNGMFTPFSTDEIFASTGRS
jgi:hypothetical protein